MASKNLEMYRPSAFSSTLSLRWHGPLVQTAPQTFSISAGLRMVRLLHLELLAASPAEVHTIKERVMTRVIEFYVPKNFRNAFVRADQPQPGTVIEFSAQAKKSVPTRPVGGVLGWLLAAT